MQITMAGMIAKGELKIQLDAAQARNIYHVN